jgi:sugar lactone lactonase YvrE
MHVVKLNRGRAPDGTVTIAPSVVWNAPGWDDQFLAEADNEVSIENSVAISGDTLYFANSAGLVQGWDISGLRTGTGPPQRVFRFWTGEGTDASVVVDEQGMLYVGSEWEKHRPRAADVGQMMKLDPHRADNPLVRSQKDEGAEKAGVWGTPGIWATW